MGKITLKSHNVSQTDKPFFSNEKLKEKQLEEDEEIGLRQKPKKKIINSSNTNRALEKPPTFSLRKKSQELSSTTAPSRFNRLSSQGGLRLGTTDSKDKLEIKRAMAITINS